jgi:hypothetical protein
MKKLTAIKFSPLSGEIILPDNSKLSFARLDKEKFQLRIVVKWEHEKNFKLSISDFPVQLVSVNKDIGILDEFVVSLVDVNNKITKHQPEIKLVKTTFGSTYLTINQK